MLTEVSMKQTLTLTSWRSSKVSGYRKVEYACDYYYVDGQCVGSSGCYYTGRYR